MWMKKRGEEKVGLAAWIMFFFDVFLALMIITGAWVLIETSFGVFSLFFGFVMLFITVVLKLMRMW